MINDKPIIDNQGNGDGLENNAVPMPNLGSEIIQHGAAGSILGSSDGFRSQQQISSWLQRQPASSLHGNMSAPPGRSLLAGMPLSNLKKEQRRDWSDSGRGNRSKKKRDRKNDRENKKKRRGNRGGGRDFDREDIFGTNDRKRGNLKQNRGTMKKREDWAKALGSYPVVSAGMKNNISKLQIPSFNMSTR